MDKTQMEGLKKLPFEKALERLEGIVSKMESGNLPLEDMMKTFEEGQFLASVCGEKLKAVEKKIEVLKKDADGQASWERFEETGEALRNAPTPQHVQQPVQTQPQQTVQPQAPPAQPPPQQVQNDDFLF